MSLTNETKDIQSKLAEYARTGSKKEIEGARDDRLHHYRRLVYNVVKGVLDQGFPIAKEIMGEERWDDLVFDFFKRHKCQENEVWKMPSELVEFVDKTNYQESIGLPYLPELLLFEWLEIQVHGMQDVALPNTQEFGSDLDEALVLNPYLEIAQFQYPVHLRSASEMEANKGHYYLLIYRELDSHLVKFMNLTGFTAILLDTLGQSPKTLRHALNEMGQSLGMEITHEIEQKAIEFIEKMVEKGVVLGVK
ncbi:HvfC family RiPP maturation protein [Salibacter halophilus]|uniref:Uncharacterized protein n=1 Tax=Salibacter halophilus TaxID=1803916 RepID=A0A6N6M6M3_9FLAO|nr:putative DNA-binding domain-containing protein [Salibacter halophilus]KAB1064062.1 hypothetical protein F3059_08495 [Salibacter halophilus]